MTGPGSDLGSLRLAYVLDPRFPGGTSAAVAAELDLVSTLARVEVHALETRMFRDRPVAPGLRDVLLRRGLTVLRGAREIAADVVILHNPSCLKYQDRLEARIIARHLIVVTHENFLRPGGAPGFDVARCLTQIAEASVALGRHLAPISAWNREVTERWCAGDAAAEGWSVIPRDWTNICAFETRPPVSAPRDRRGRHSRPGMEKFPGRAALDRCFPATAEHNLILGADMLMEAGDAPLHWTLHPFGGLTLDAYFAQIDFFVYFTAPTWRESFGRVIAEAVAAGKIAITDPDTARLFDGAAVAARPEEVDGIIAGYIADPARYRDDVLAAQAVLRRFSAESFRQGFERTLADLGMAA